MYTAGLLYYVYSIPTNVYCSHTVLCVQQTYFIMCKAGTLYYVYSMHNLFCVQQKYCIICTVCLLNCTVGKPYFMYSSSNNAYSRHTVLCVL